MNADDTKKLIKEILEKMDIEVRNISVNNEINFSKSELRPKTTWFSVEVSHPHLFSDRGGEALSALNHLIKRIFENKLPRSSSPLSIEERHTEPSILIDINDYQKKKVENVHAIAHMMAERARYFKSNIETDPMPAFERRIIHEFLSDATDLKTESEGEGHSRRVIIKYIGSI